MSQVFHPRSNLFLKVFLLLLLIGAPMLVFAAAVFTRSAFHNRLNVPITQPIPFSHEHHANVLKIDCRYCHTSVENSAFAGIPPTEICMTCHSQIWTNSPVLEPVRESFRENKPLHWQRVYDVPDFVYFDHSIHIAKGVQCAECHGRVESMPAIHKVTALEMSWCLNCHDKKPVTRTAETLPPAHPNIHPKQIENCSVCHH